MKHDTFCSCWERLNGATAYSQSQGPEGNDRCSSVHSVAAELCGYKWSVDWAQDMNFHLRNLHYVMPDGDSPLLTEAHLHAISTYCVPGTLCL